MDCLEGPITAGVIAAPSRAGGNPHSMGVFYDMDVTHGNGVRA